MNEIMEVFNGEKLSRTAIAKSLGRKTAEIKEELDALVESGEIVRREEGKRTFYFRFVESGEDEELAEDEQTPVDEANELEALDDEHVLRTLFQRHTKHYEISPEEAKKYAEHGVSKSEIERFVQLRQDLFNLSNEARYSMDRLLSLEDDGERVAEFGARFANIIDEAEKLKDFKALNSLAKHSISRGAAIILDRVTLQTVFERDPYKLHKELNTKSRPQKQSATWITKFGVYELDTFSAVMKKIYHARSHDSLRRRMAKASYQRNVTALITSLKKGEKCLRFDRVEKRFVVVTSDNAADQAERHVEQYAFLYA